MNVANKVKIIDEVSLAKYLDRLNNSIQLSKEFEETPDELLRNIGAEYMNSVLEAISELEGFGAPKGSLTWDSRVSNWNRDSKILANTGDTLLIINEGKFNSSLRKSCKGFIPLFDNYITNKFYQEISTNQEKEPTMRNNSMKSLFNQVLDTNKDAAVLSAKLTAGKSANTFIQEKLFKMLPWYSRFFTKKKDAAKNPVAKLVTANIAVVLSTHFGNDPKLKWVSEAMLEDAMVTLTRDSAMVDNLIQELQQTVSIPDSVLKQFNESNNS